MDFIPFHYAISAIIFVVACCTDFIDGHIARSRNLVTNLGKFLDPIADKVLVSTAMVVLLTMKNSLFTAFGAFSDVVYLATVIAVCIITAREFIISAFRQIAAVSGIVMAAEKLGKYKTAVQDAALFVLFLATDFPDMMGVMGAWIGIALFAIATVLTVWSGVSYVVKNKQVIKED
jgi:CDP-diacylglycerol--glycerol-3-phosphate 3-phosphatidyltransferase